jgi:hypothetical protein
MESNRRKVIFPIISENFSIRMKRDCGSNSALANPSKIESIKKFFSKQKCQDLKKTGAFNGDKILTFLKTNSSRGG